MKNKIVALIPLRGGSKSIPYKNIKEMAGQPLAYWVCKAAKEAKNIDEVYVSTEDKKIMKVVDSFGLGIKIIERPMALAMDNASTESVLLDFAEKVDFDILVTIQATSPTIKHQHLDEAINQFIKNNNDAMLSGVLSKRFYWALDGKPINYDYLNRPRRQDFSGTIVENGAFYITKREVLLNLKSRLGGNIGIYQMPEYSFVEIDEPSDWERVELQLKKFLNIIKL